jgi:hypothetical protein
VVVEHRFGHSHGMVSLRVKKELRE